MVDFVTLSLVKEFAKCVIIEDEFHFLCICPIYQNLRENLYSSYYNISNDFIDLSDDQKFVYMLKQPIRNLNKFVTLAWNLRKSKLFY